MNTIIETLIKLRNENETQWLRTRKEILEYYLRSVPAGKKDLLFDELNQLAKEINEKNENEKSE